ncbi:carbohydrate-binding family 9-like protein [Candidatus Latescibacterota bacterium]
MAEEDSFLDMTTEKYLCKFQTTWVLVVLSILFLMAYRCGCVCQENATYVVKRTTEKIYPDGNISERDWKEAQPIEPFVFPWYKEGTQDQTRVRILWDDQYLYFLFFCEDEHISAHHYQRNSGTCLDDCAEIFISPNRDKPTWYINYEINCLGTWLLGFNRGFKEPRDKEPDGLIIGRSHVGTINNEEDVDSNWILEIAIPLDHFRGFEGQIPPRDEDVWRLNLNRCGGDINSQYSQWTPSQTPNPNFHRPQDFGKIIFSSVPVR